MIKEYIGKTILILIHIVFIQSNQTILSRYAVPTTHQVISISPNSISCSFFLRQITTGIVRHSIYKFSPVSSEVVLDNTIIRSPDLTFKQFIDFNTLTTNSYLAYNNTQLSFEVNNFSSTIYISTFSTALKLDATFGNSVDIFYQLVQSLQAINVQKCQKIVNSFSCQLFAFIPNQFEINMIFANGKIYLLTFMISSPGSGKLRVYSDLGILQSTHNFILGTFSTLYFRVNQRYVLILIDLKANIYEIATNYTFLCQFPIIGSQIYDAQLVEYTIFVSVDSEIRQYSVFDGFILMSSTTISSIVQLKIAILKGSGNMILWVPNSSDVFFYTYTQTYTCIGCTCHVNFCFDSVLSECYPCFVTPLNNFNSSVCLVQNISYCQIYCLYPCSRCSQSVSICDECVQYYVKNDGKCEMETQIQALITLLSLLNIFRLNNAQRAYFFVGNLQFYNYHSTNFDGIIQRVFDFMDFVDNQIWIIMPHNYLIDWVAQPYELPNYNAFTNPKFLEVQRKDTLFSQTTKAYSTVYIPFTILAFVLLNRVFYLLFNFKFSSVFRIFSFWLYLVVIIVVQNLMSITFLSYRDFQNMFSLNFYIYFSKYLTVIFYGFCIILAISTYFLSSYLYKGLSKHFISNLYRVKYAFLCTTIRIVIKPAMESIVHATLYESPVAQLTMLGVLNILTLALLLFFQLNFEMFLIKTVFAAEVMYEFCMLLLNFGIYVKYYYGQEGLNDLCEQLFTIIFCMFMAVSIFSLLGALIMSIKSNFCLEQPKDQDSIEEQMHVRKNTQKKKTLYLGSNKQTNKIQESKLKETKNKNEKKLANKENKPTIKQSQKQNGNKILVRVKQSTKVLKIKSLKSEQIMSRETRKQKLTSSRNQDRNNQAKKVFLVELIKVQ